MSHAIIPKPSPNHSPRPAGVKPDLLIIHGTAGKSDAGDIAWCRDPVSKVSYHYIVGRDGKVYQLVADDRKAWHAGLSDWQGRGNCNDYSIGIGLSNRGDGEKYTDAQYTALRSLVGQLRTKHGIPWERVVGHYHVSPGRKTDPWYSFEWMRMV